tara:strand:- start:404 stop:778 length:375 start_codon:yes stop_codon:yes gene_type:complete
MNNSNDFLSFINRKLQDGGINSISDVKRKILSKETDIKKVFEVLDRIETEKQLKNTFMQTNFFDILKNIFGVLNEILNDFTEKKELNLKIIKETLNKEQRIIYIGIFMIICAIFLALIEISDSV